MNVLHIEDDRDHIELVAAAAKLSQAPFKIQVIKDGLEALYRLNNRGPYKDIPLPDLIILDLTTSSYISGLEILDEIKAGPLLKLIPLFILTSEDVRPDILLKYALRAECWHTKPAGINGYVEVMKSIMFELEQQGVLVFN
jgi:CheY-like chemotaxis protein